MSRIDYRLTLALTLSLLLHLAPLLEGLTQTPQKSAQATPLQAQLRPATPPPPPVPLKLEEAAPQQTRPAPPVKTLSTEHRSARAITWQDEIRQQLQKQQARGEFYPPEAIAQGLEGETLILLLIDQNGQIAAARIEQSSGHRLLDAAALRAIRALSSLPAATPRELVLPVRFRLR